MFTYAAALFQTVPAAMSQVGPRHMRTRFSWSKLPPSPYHYTSSVNLPANVTSTSPNSLSIDLFFCYDLFFLRSGFLFRLFQVPCGSYFCSQSRRTQDKIESGQTNLQSNHKCDSLSRVRVNVWRLPLESCWYLTIILLARVGYEMI